MACRAGERFANDAAEKDAGDPSADGAPAGAEAEGPCPGGVGPCGSGRFDGSGRSCGFEGDGSRAARFGSAGLWVGAADTASGAFSKLTDTARTAGHGATMDSISRSRGSSAYATNMATSMVMATPCSPKGRAFSQPASITGISDPAKIPAASIPRPRPNTSTGDMRNRCASMPKNTHIMASKLRYPISSARFGKRSDPLRADGKNSSATAMSGTSGRK